MWNPTSDSVRTGVSICNLVQLKLKKTDVVVHPSIDFNQNWQGLVYSNVQEHVESQVDSIFESSGDECIHDLVNLGWTTSVLDES